MIKFRKNSTGEICLVRKETKVQYIIFTPAYQSRFLLFNGQLGKVEGRDDDFDANHYTGRAVAVGLVAVWQLPSKVKGGQIHTSTYISSLCI